MLFPSKDVRITGERQRKAVKQCKISFGRIVGHKAPVQESGLLRRTNGDTGMCQGARKFPQDPIGRAGMGSTEKQDMWFPWLQSEVVLLGYFNLENSTMKTC